MLFLNKRNDSAVIVTIYSQPLRNSSSKTDAAGVKVWHFFQMICIEVSNAGSNGRKHKLLLAVLIILSKQSAYTIPLRTNMEALYSKS